MTVWLAAGQQGAGGSAPGRVVLVAVVALALAAFAILQARARSRGRRRPDLFDWRIVPPPRRPDESYGYPPGYQPYPRYDPARSPWAVPEERARDRA